MVLFRSKRFQSHAGRAVCLATTLRDQMYKQHRPPTLPLFTECIQWPVLGGLFKTAPLGW